MLSRPDSSPLKPAPSSSSEDTRPFTSTVPVVGRRIPVRIFSSVDFPDPLCPISPTVWPAGISRSTSRRAWNGSAVPCPIRRMRSLRLVARPLPRKLLPTPRARMAISPPTQSSSAKSADSRW
jgi:hypothetical protein